MKNAPQEGFPANKRYQIASKIWKVSYGVHTSPLQNSELVFYSVHFLSKSWWWGEFYWAGGVCTMEQMAAGSYG